MAEGSSAPPNSVNPAENRLDSWKEIAAYLNRDVTTVQRWEKREGMPVHRHVHDRIGSVYAFRTELDAWTGSRKLQGATDSENKLSPTLDSLPDSRSLGLWTSLVSWKVAVPLVAVVAALAIGVGLWLQKTEYFWRSPIAGARFQTVTDFEGVEQAAEVSRDGQFVAFLSDRDGQMDVWVTQVGSGQFHNLTHGSVREVVNPSIRTIGFSPDGAFVTFWVRKGESASPTGGDIGIWAVPTLGGSPKPYLEGVAEYEWSRDGTRLAYHTPGAGDPLFVGEGGRRAEDHAIFAAPAGLHSHFPSWSPDGTFLYFVQGSLPDKLDIWRIQPTGGNSERITSHNGRVSYPVLLDRRTLLYLATDADGSGPWIYSEDAERRIPHRLTSGLDRYTSLGANADGHRLVVTVARPKTTFWRMRIGALSTDPTATARISLTSSAGFSPRIAQNNLLYISATGTAETIWKLSNGNSVELWSGQDARVIGGPAVSADGQRVAFSVKEKNHTALYVTAIDGTNARVVTDSLELLGDPAWAPDGKTILSAAAEKGVPHLYSVPVDGRPPTVFVQEYSIDPVWSPDGRLVIYTGPDIGTTFSVKAVKADGTAQPLAALTLTRGARHMAFFPGGREIVVLQGEIQHKNLWVVNIETGAQRKLTNLASDFDVRNFDVSTDGSEVVLERVQEESDVMLLEIPRP